MSENEQKNYKNNQSGTITKEMESVLSEFQIATDADDPDCNAEENMLRQLFFLYQKYPKSSTYLEHIADKMPLSQNAWKNDPLRLKILKQFVRFGDCLKDAGYGGKNLILKVTGCKDSESAADKLKDDVFSCLKDAKQKDLGRSGKYGLLYAADRLASDTFVSGGITIRELYLLGICYGMTYYHENSEAPMLKTDGKVNTDVEKILFYDYYGNHLIRNETKDQHPAERGINYNNFAEIIYLYYLAQRPSAELTVKERIRRAEKMIAEVMNTTPAQTVDRHGTRIFKQNAVSKNEEDSVFALNEEDFKDYIIQNYNTYVPVGFTPFDCEKEQASAFKQYQIVCEKLAPYQTCKNGENGEDSGNSKKQNLNIKLANALLDEIVRNTGSFDVCRLSDPKEQGKVVFGKKAKKWLDTRTESEYPQLEKFRAALDMMHMHSVNKKTKKYIVSFRDQNDLDAAYKLFVDEYKRIQEIQIEIDQESIDDNNQNYGLSFLCVNPDHLKQVLNAQEDEWSVFMKMLREVDRRLVRDDGKPINDPKQISRSELLRKIYYYFTAVKLSILEEENNSQTIPFEDYFLEFKVTADQYLTPAFYQELNVKNLYDVILAYSSYAYIYI